VIASTYGSDRVRALLASCLTDAVRRRAASLAGRIGAEVGVLPGRFCQNSKTILAERSHFWSADLPILMQREPLTNELPPWRSNEHQRTSKENQAWFCNLLLPTLPTYLHGELNRLELNERGYWYLDAPAPPVPSLISCFPLSTIHCGERSLSLLSWRW
jgi:hypothetical protein